MFEILWQMCEITLSFPQNSVIGLSFCSEREAASFHVTMVETITNRSKKRSSINGTTKRHSRKRTSVKNINGNFCIFFFIFVKN